MPSPTTDTYDVTVHVAGGRVQYLVLAETSTEAREKGEAQAKADGHKDAQGHSAVVYPPARRIRPAFARTDP